MKLPAFTPRSLWTPPNLAALPSWADAKRVAVDIETRDPDLKTLGPGVRRGGYITGVSFAIEDGPAHYLPVAHEGGGNVDKATAFRYLADQGRAFKGDLVTANGQYDLDYLAEAGVRYTPRFFRDVQIAEPICDELQFTYGLDAILTRRGFPGKDEAMLRGAAGALGLDPKLHMWRLHSKYVGAYAESDAAKLLPLLRVQERQIDDENLWQVYDLECRLMPALLKMRRRGVRVDFDQLDRIEQWSIEEEEKALAELKRLTGIGLTREDTTRTAALVPLVKYMGVPIPRTAPTKNHPTGQDSLTKEFLDSLHGEIGGLINRARRFNKLRGTFVEGRRLHAINGRVHPTFNQLRSEKPGQDDDGGARYGRLSCSDPNLQQEPARDEEIGPQWRKVYVPEPGCEWACLDFSQQEPRWAVHFAEALKMPGASAAGDRYRSDPKADNHDMMTILIHGQAAWDSWDKPTRKLHRGRAKNIFLGLCYGMGGAKLCRDLGLEVEVKKVLVHAQSGRSYKYNQTGYICPETGRVEVIIPTAGPEGQALLDQFDKALPWIRGTAEKAQDFASLNGYVRTVLGRKCRFPPLDPRDPSIKPWMKRRQSKFYDWCHKAFNRAIQGSSGDQTKKAVVDADAAGLITEDLSRDSINLQVHDELDGSFSSRDNIRLLAQIMREAVSCKVPHRVDAEVGPNWADLKELE